MFHPPIVKKWIDPSQPSDQFGHSSRYSSRFFIHHDVLHEFLFHYDFLVTVLTFPTFLTFPNFLFEGVERCNVLF